MFGKSWSVICSSVLFSLVLQESWQTTTAFQTTQWTRRYYEVRTPTSLAAASSHRKRREGIISTLGADDLESMIGGERYEMVPLPDSMVDTTLFVGNLNEFVYDADLSDLFQDVSFLTTLPACVARKPNMDSLNYGFVTFPTVEEKDAAILRFHGIRWKGSCIRVEPIRDHPKLGRVRVPERMVSYVSGAAKKTRDGRVNTLRRISRMEKQNHSSSSSSSGRQHPQIQSKSAGGGGKSVSYSKLVRKLGKADQQEFYRAVRKGFVTLSGTGYRRGRRSCLLACAHRKWCEEHCKPQILLCKASGGRPLDNVIIDMSTLRPDVNSLKDDDDEEDGDDDTPRTVDELLVKQKVQIVAAASASGMILRHDYKEDNCIRLSSSSMFDDDDDKDDDDNDDDLQENESSTPTLSSNYKQSKRTFSWATTKISKLPTLSMGVFEGERTQAKAMVRDLATAWEIPDDMVQMDDLDGNKCSFKKGRKGRGKDVVLDKRRSRRNNHRRDKDVDLMLSL